MIQILCKKWECGKTKFCSSFITDTKQNQADEKFVQKFVFVFLSLSLGLLMWLLKLKVFTLKHISLNIYCVIYVYKNLI